MREMAHPLEIISSSARPGNMLRYLASSTFLELTGRLDVRQRVVKETSSDFGYWHALLYFQTNSNSSRRHVDHWQQFRAVLKSSPRSHDGHNSVALANSVCRSLQIEVGVGMAAAWQELELRRLQPDQRMNGEQLAQLGDCSLPFLAIANDFYVCAVRERQGIPVQSTLQPSALRRCLTLPRAWASWQLYAYLAKSVLGTHSPFAGCRDSVRFLRDFS